MHGVAGLVGEGEDVVEDFFLEVHEDVGGAIEPAGGKSTGGFAGVGIAVGPPSPPIGGEAFAEGLGVFAAQGRQRIADEIGGLVPGVTFVDATDDGDIGVVHMDIRDIHARRRRARYL